MNGQQSTMSRFRAFGRRMLNACKRRPDFFLKDVKGVIHIGANAGQERDHYAAHDLNVLWIEPIPEVFSRLRDHIAVFPKQRAVCQLMTDVDGREYSFHISNNEGQSSSIFDLELHKELWPEVSYTREIKLKSLTLPTLIHREGIDLGLYDALIMDTQGSELLILKGAVEILPRFRFIKTEAPNFAAYQNCCQVADLDNFMQDIGFRPIDKQRIARKKGVGAYFDITYGRRAR